MSEIGALVGIYGAVDRAAQASPEMRAQVSRLLPLYGDSGLHWFDEFESWLKERHAKEGVGPSPVALFPPLEQALSELAEVAPTGRLRARRLFAIAVAMRAFPQMREAKSKLGKLVVDALSVSELAGEGEQENARSLHALLAAETHLPAINAGSDALRNWWNGLVTNAAEEGFISNTNAMFPRPCSGRLVSVPGVEGPVAALETEFETDAIDFAQASNFLNPVNWAKCMPSFWCAMQPLAAAGRVRVNGASLYREVVSSDECALGNKAAFWAETELEFEPGSPAGAAFTNYRLATGRPYIGDPIRVDEGSLVVAKVEAGERPLRITTTKRIQFSYPFSSEALATIMCALGYGDVVGELFCCAATNPRGVVGFGPTAAGGAIGGGVAVALGACIEECVAATGECSSRIAEGPYTAEQLARDMANTWAWVMRKGATAAQLGASVTQTATATSAPAGAAASALGVWASLANAGGFQLAAQTLNALAGVGGWGGDQNIVTSQPFKTRAGATLKLAGALREGGGLDELPESVVSILPGPGKKEFTLQANATGHRGATYLGTVKALTTKDGAQSEEVPVWITVP